MKLSYSIPKGYRIQLARADDIPLLDVIEAAAGTIFPPGSIPENILAERVPHDLFMEAMRKGRLLVVVDSTQPPVGFAFWQEVAGCALLALVEVDPQHGQQGLGAALVSRIINQVVQAGFPYLYLTTFANVPWNAPFYQKLGFVILNDAEQPGFIKEILLDEQGRGLNNRVAMRYSIPATSR